MPRLIAMRDIIGAARESSFGYTDGLSFSDNWDSMPLSELDEALEGAGISKDMLGEVAPEDKTVMTYRVSTNKPMKPVTVNITATALVSGRKLLGKGKRG